MRGLVRLLYELSRRLNDITSVMGGRGARRIRNKLVGRAIGKRIFK